MYPTARVDQRFINPGYLLPHRHIQQGRNIAQKVRQYLSLKFDESRRRLNQAIASIPALPLIGPSEPNEEVLEFEEVKQLIEDYGLAFRNLTGTYGLTLLLFTPSKEARKSRKKLLQEMSYKVKKYTLAYQRLLEAEAKLMHERKSLMHHMPQLLEILDDIEHRCEKGLKERMEIAVRVKDRGLNESINNGLQCFRVLKDSLHNIASGNFDISIRSAFGSPTRMGRYFTNTMISFFTGAGPIISASGNIIKRGWHVNKKQRPRIRLSFRNRKPARVNDSQSITRSLPKTKPRIADLDSSDITLMHHEGLNTNLHRKPYYSA